MLQSLGGEKNWVFEIYFCLYIWDQVQNKTLWMVPTVVCTPLSSLLLQYKHVWDLKKYIFFSSTIDFFSSPMSPLGLRTTYLLFIMWHEVYVTNKHKWNSSVMKQSCENPELTSEGQDGGGDWRMRRRKRRSHTDLPLRWEYLLPLKFGLGCSWPCRRRERSWEICCKAEEEKEIKR